VRYSFVPVWLFINEGTVLYSVTHTVMIMEILSSHAKFFGIEYYWILSRRYIKQSVYVLV